MLAVPGVLAEVETYLRRNGPLEDACYYLLTQQHGDSTRIRVSSTMSKDLDQVWPPCTFAQVGGQWLAIRTAGCMPLPEPEATAELARRAPALRLLEGVIRKGPPDATGQREVDFSTLVLYDPEVLLLVVYRNRVVSKVISPY